jgi:hypothetical protein
MRRKLLKWADSNAVFFPCGIMLLAPLLTMIFLISCAQENKRPGSVSFPEEVRAIKSGDTLVVTEIPQDYGRSHFDFGFYHGGPLKSNQYLTIYK